MLHATHVCWWESFYIELTRTNGLPSHQSVEGKVQLTGDGQGSVRQPPHGHIYYLSPSAMRKLKKKKQTNPDESKRRNRRANHTHRRNDEIKTGFLCFLLSKSDKWEWSLKTDETQHKTHRANKVVPREEGAALLHPQANQTGGLVGRVALESRASRRQIR